MSKFVFSKLPSSTAYTEWQVGPGGIQTEVRRVLVKGGAGVANKQLITPQGIMTEVTDADAEFLLNDHHFKQHQKNGFVTLTAGRAEVETVVADLSSDPTGADPLTESSYADSSETAPLPQTLAREKKSRKVR